MTRYVSEAEPTVGIVPFDEWCVPSTGDISRRNSTNSGWTLVGNADSRHLGTASRYGYEANGNILGVTGFAAATSPAFVTSATINGVDVAVDTNLTDTESYLDSVIMSRMTSSIRNYQNKVSSSSHIAISSGVFEFDTTDGGFDTAQTIPLPVFSSDSVSATEEQCKWLPSATFYRINDRTDSPAGDVVFTYSTDPTATRTFSAASYSSNMTLRYECETMYIIIGIR